MAPSTNTTGFVVSVAVVNVVLANHGEQEISVSFNAEGGFHYRAHRL